jgi:hypothetical protein
MAKAPEAGKGSLNTNDRRTNDKAPLYRGLVTDPTGKTWELSGWLRSGSYGEFISLAIKEPYAGKSDAGQSDYQKPQESRQRASVGHNDPFSDEIPF